MSDPTPVPSVMSVLGDSVGVVSMLTTSGHRLPGAPGRLVTETAAWGALIVLVAISYLVAGSHGLFTTISPQAYPKIAEALVDGGFDNQSGSLSLLIVFVLAGAGLFIPTRVFATRGPQIRKLALSVASLILAALLIVLSIVPSAWLAWVTALVLGTLVGLLISVNPFTNEKPWRRMGVPAAALLFLTCAFQLLGGPVAGTRALGWMSLLIGIAAAVGAVIIYLTPERVLHAETATTGAFPEVKARIARPPANVAKPWVCIALFAVLGTTLILAQPTAVEHEFGQVGFALILACSLLGWAIGFEMGPTFAPGMSRPRVSAFALTVSGMLLIATGALNELSGKVVLSAAIAFLVGIGVRSQPYDFSRRIGAAAGAVLALGINALNVAVIVPVGLNVEWAITPSELAYGLIGLAALVAGIVGLFIFDPHGIQGLSVDIVHGFRPPNSADNGSSGAVGAPADRLGAGFFIAIEGGDGSGKSTQIKRISRALADNGYNVEATREPGGTELGRKIRSVLFDAEPPSPRTEALLFAADRAHHIASLVDPSLEAGNIVITDRYIDSTIAYQAAGRQFDQATILALSRWATQGLIPHLTIVLDIDPEVAAARMGERGESNYLDEENQQFHQRVRQTYLSRAAKEPARYVVVDASVSEDELTAEILAAIRARLPRQLGVKGPAGAGLGTGAESTASASVSTSVSVSTADLADPAKPEEHDIAEAVDDRDEGETVDPRVDGAGSVPRIDDGDELSNVDGNGISTERFDTVGETDIDVDESIEPPADDEVTRVVPNPAEKLQADEAEEAEKLPAAEAEKLPAEEAATTVIPPRGFTPAAPLANDDDEDDEDNVPTTVIETSGNAEAADTPETEVASEAESEAETRVLPVKTARELSRDKLQAQAEIERQARERLRKQRERTQARFNHPKGDR